MIGRPPNAFRDFPEWYIERTPTKTDYGDFRPLTAFDQRRLIKEWSADYHGLIPFYLYFLFDAQLAEHFYVGIANRVNRPTEHLRDAWNGKENDVADRIRQIERSGYSVKYDIIELMFMGGEALESEKWIIKRIGRGAGGPLLNVGPGGEGPWNLDDLYI